MKTCLCKCHQAVHPRVYEDYGFTFEEFNSFARLGRFAVVGYDKKGRQLWVEVGGWS